MSNDPTKPTSFKDAAFQKLLGQETNTIMLIAILCASGYAFWWGITVGVPSHLREIRSGYMEVSTEHGKQQESLQRTFEKTLDRIERRFEQRPAPVSASGE